MSEFRSPTVDAVLDALSHPRRRFVVYLLLDQTHLTVEKLTAEITAYERTQSSSPQSSSTPTASPQPDQSEIKISLVHNHLPRLADANVIEYDARSGMVRRRDLESVPWSIIDDLADLEAELSVPLGDTHVADLGLDN